ncbi:MAG: hypothetical protein EHM42_08045, partial [Planctomycetaceae bacterium]
MMLTLWRRVFALSLVLGLGGAWAHADEGVVLRHKFVKGTDAIYENTQKMTQSQTFGGMNIETVMDQVQVTRQTVDEVDSKGQAKVRVKNEQMRMKMAVKPAFDYEFDSKKADNDKSS